MHSTHNAIGQRTRTILIPAEMMLFLIVKMPLIQIKFENNRRFRGPIIYTKCGYITEMKHQIWAVFGI